VISDILFFLVKIELGHLDKDKKFVKLFQEKGMIF